MIGTKLTPTEFAKFYFEFGPTDYQMKAMDDLSKRKVLRWGRQCGKSTVTALEALYEAMWNDNSTILILAPTQNQSNELFEKIKGFIQTSRLKLPELAITDLIESETARKITLWNGSRIVSLTVGKEGRSVRGYSPQAIIVDEAAFIQDDKVWSAILPMLAVTKGRLIIISTPRGTNNYFWEICRNRKLGFAEYHATYLDNPHADHSMIELDKERLPEIQWREEYLATFE